MPSQMDVRLLNLDSMFPGQGRPDRTSAAEVLLASRDPWPRARKTPGSAGGAGGMPATRPNDPVASLTR